MKSRHEIPWSKAPDSDQAAAPRRPRTVGATLLHVLAYDGLGAWMLLGLSLAVGVYPDGRGDVLVPLALGGMLTAIGLLAACMHLRWMPVWHGWRIGKGARPTRDALITLATVLPAMAVAGLARGDNAFWATRLAGSALTLCSLGSLIITAHSDARRQAPGIDIHLATQLPLSRVVSAAYGGGLWLWVCATGQDSSEGHGHPLAWIVTLLSLALLRGLIESLRWQAALQRVAGPRARLELQPRRYLAAFLAYAMPSLALMLMSFTEGHIVIAAIAAISCSIGMAIELSLYDGALAALPDSH